MNYAIDSDGLEVNIESVLCDDGTIRRKGFVCKCCNEEVEVAYGPKRQYFRHKCENSECIANWYDHCMTEWHRNWQALFQGFPQEHYVKNEDGEFRRADVVCGDYVVEFQHSRITDEEALARTNFYQEQGKAVIWLFDLTKIWTWQEDFKESSCYIEGIRLHEINKYHASDYLKVGVRVIDTNATILIAEVRDAEDEIALVRLFRKDKKILGYNYGSSREKLVRAIINGDLKVGLTITDIRDIRKKNKPSDDIPRKRLEEFFRPHPNNDDLVESSYSKSYEPKAGQEQNLIRIVNRSDIDMTKIIEGNLSLIGCKLINTQQLFSEDDKSVVEYTIDAPRYTEKELLRELMSLATEGMAPLYGAYFSIQ